MVVALNSMAVWMLQSEGAGDQHKMTIYSLIIAVALVGQAAGVIGVAIYAAKLLKKVVDFTDAFETKTTPLIVKANTLVDDLAPKIKNITANVEDISYTVKVKVDELAVTVEHLNRTVQDINERSKVQISRVDGIVTDALATTHEVQQSVQEGIKKPVRQIAGIIAGVKVGIETLIARSPFPFGKRNETSPYDL